MKSILKSALHTMGFGIVLVLGQNANGQGTECMSYSEPDVEQQSATCGQFGDAFTARFRLIRAYVPGQPLNPGTVKTIRIAVHVWQDELGGNNYPDNEQTRALINGAIEHIHTAFWSENDLPSDPIPGAHFISDTRFRVDYSGITFHQNATLNSLVPSVDPQADWSLQAIAEDPEMEKCLMLHLVCPCNFVGVDGTEHPGVAGAATPGSTGGDASSMNYIVSKGRYDASQNNIDALSGHWAHEIGHILGLNHTYAPLNETCSATNQNFLWDVFGTGPCPHQGDGNCVPTLPPSENSCTNNIMGATGQAGYYSPLQMGRMHMATNRYIARKYVRGYDPVPFVVPESETWYFVYKSYQDIIVPAGVKLTIKCLLELVPEAKVIVEPGGQLIIDGGTITAAQFADSWAGIEVCGYNTKNQYSGWRNGQYLEYLNQGYLELKNGGTIEHARTGIVMEDNGVSGTSGGVVVSNGGIIRNCQRGVEFKRYRNFTGNDPNAGTTMPNRSHFYNTSFTVDPNYRGSDDFEYHVKMAEVSGVDFVGCSFDNRQTTITESDKLGYGIYSMDAHYKVKASCETAFPPGGTCPENMTVPSKFIGLDHGIHALTGGSGRTFQVDHSTFTDNVCGVYTEGVVGFKVVECDFTVGGRDVTLTGDIEDPAWDGRHRAVFSNTGYGFIIDDNEITQSPSGTNLTEGVVIGYSYEHNDMLFRNTAHRLESAFIGEGVCASTTNPAIAGFHYRCNTSDDNETNFWSRRVDGDVNTYDEQTIRAIQGHGAWAPDNEFDRDAARVDFMNTNAGNVVRYHWAVPQAPYQPEHITDDVVLVPNAWRPYGNCTTRGWVAYTYPQPPRRDPLIGQLNQHKIAYANNRYLYEDLLDGGSTDDVLAEIQASWPQEAWELRTYLLSLSPFLTVEALKAAVSKPSFPEAMRAEICIANPDATQKEGFLKWLQYYAPYPVSESVINTIIASWDQHTYRTQLEETLANHHGEMTQATNLLLEYHWSDTVEHMDSLKGVWQLLRTPGARYAEALIDMQEGQYNTAIDLIEALPEEHELKSKEESERWRMLAFIDFAKVIAGDDRNLSQLTPSEIEELEDMVADQRDRAATWIQNILCFYYGHCRAPLSGGDPELPKARRNIVDGVEEASKPSLDIYPNPAGNWVTLNVALGNEPVDGALIVQDFAGRTVQRIRVGSATQSLLLDTREFAPGAYTVQLTDKGRILSTEKLIIRQ